MQTLRALAVLAGFLCTASAIRLARGGGEDAESVVMQLQDTSNQALWQQAWSMTLDKYHYSADELSAVQSAQLQPEAQKVWKSLLEARHHLKERSQEQSSSEQSQQESEEQQQQDQLDDLKRVMADKLTARLKTVKDDDDVPTTTTTTTTEDPQAVKDREEMEAAKEGINARLQKNMHDAAMLQEEEPAATTTTTEDPQAKADREQLEAMKEKMASKLTAGVKEADDQPVAPKVHETTTTTTTMDAKALASLLSGQTKIFANYQPQKEIAAVQMPTSTTSEAPSGADSEAAADFEIDNMS